MSNVTVGTCFIQMVFPAIWQEMEIIASLGSSLMLERLQIPYDLSDSKEHLLHKRNGSRSNHLISGTLRVTSPRTRGSLVTHSLAVILISVYILLTLPLRPSPESPKVAFLATSNGYPHCGHWIKNKWSEAKLLPGTMFFKKCIYFNYKLNCNSPCNQVRNN